MSSGTRSSRVEREGEEREQQKEAVMKTLREEMNISQDDIDFLYAHFGEKCLVSIEKFFEYKEIDEKKMRSSQARQGDIGAHSLYQEVQTEASGYHYGSESVDENKCKGEAEMQLSTTEKEVNLTEHEHGGKWLLVDGCSEIERHIGQFGFKGITDVLRRHLDAWKGKPLDIAVTGESGKGKSSLINALRNMNDLDEGAAKVGVKETTKVCRSYPHPEHKNIVFWDVPGVGTLNFPKATYIEQIKLHRYDFFMIILSERFTEIDVWLAKEILKQNKHFYFIRTKIEHDIANIKRQTKGNYDEKKEFDKLKKDLRAEITSMFSSSHFRFFMISNHHPDKYDFPLLLQELLEDVPNEKKLAMVFGVAGMSKTVIEEKASALRSRIWKCALASGAAAAIPIPFLSTAIDYGIILEEVIFYQEQFALDDDSLEHLAHIANVSLNQLKREVEFKAPEDIFTTGGLAKYMMKYAGGEVVEKVAKYTLPGIGTAIACGISFTTTMGVLEGILDLMKQDAIMVLVYVSEKESTA